MATRDEILASLTVLGQALEKRLPAERQMLYVEALSDLSFDELQAATTIAVRELGPFFPAPSEIRKLVRGTVEDRALTAWAALGTAASQVGGYRDIEIEDGCAAEALALVFGSWPEFCATEDGPTLSQKRQEFLAAYRRVSQRGGAAGRALKGLAGGTGRLLSSGRIELDDTPKQLGSGDGHAQITIGEAGTTQEGQGAKEARGGEGDRERAITDGGTGRVLPTRRIVGRAVRRGE